MKNPNHMAIVGRGHRPQQSLTPSIIKSCLNRSFNKLEEIASFVFSETTISHFSFQDTFLEELVQGPEASLVGQEITKFLSGYTVPKGVQLLIKGNTRFLNLSAATSIKDITESEHPSPGSRNLLWFINYSGKGEIVEAVKMAASEKKRKTDEKSMRGQLLTSGLPDPDLLILTGGTSRLPDFLIYQISYSEIYLSKKPWSQFGPDELNKALQSYALRERRYGLV